MWRWRNHWTLIDSGNMLTYRHVGSLYADTKHNNAQLNAYERRTLSTECGSCLEVESGPWAHLLIDEHSHDKDKPRILLIDEHAGHLQLRLVGILLPCPRITAPEWLATLKDIMAACLFQNGRQRVPMLLDQATMIPWFGQQIASAGWPGSMYLARSSKLDRVLHCRPWAAFVET